METIIADLAAAIAARACAAAVAAATNTTDTTNTNTNTPSEADYMSDEEMADAMDEDEELSTGELTSQSSRAVLVAYLKEEQPLLSPLIPADTTVSDLFDCVRYKKDIAEYFNESEDRAVRRALGRLTIVIEKRLDVEKAIGKLKARKERHAEAVSKSKKRLKRWHQPVEPSVPLKMSLDEAAAAKVLSEAEKEEARRSQLLSKGYTFRSNIPNGKGGGTEHHQFFFKEPKVVCASFGAELKRQEPR